MCPHGAACYRGNHEHFEEFDHPEEHERIGSKKQKRATGTTNTATEAIHALGVAVDAVAAATAAVAAALPATTRQQSGSLPLESAARYQRCPGKTMCTYKEKCYCKNVEHFRVYDHPDNHPLICKGIEASQELEAIPPGVMRELSSLRRTVMRFTDQNEDEIEAIASGKKPMP